MQMTKVLINETATGVAKLPRAARREFPESANVALSRLRFLDSEDRRIEAEQAAAQEPKFRTADREADLIEIARSATKAAREATNAARLARSAASAASGEVRVHAELALAASDSAMTALMIATAAGGATIALATALLVVALVLR
jgi:hypothetical protein